MQAYSNLTVLSHPLIAHKLTMLRDRDTSKKKFTELVDELAMLMGYEATRDLALEETTVETPLESTVSIVSAARS